MALTCGYVDTPCTTNAPRLQERDADWDLELGSAKAGRMRNNGDQCAIRISECYRDYQGRTDLFRHAEIKKPDIAPDRHHSRLDSNRSAASAVSASSKEPESNGAARRKNSTVKTRFPPLAKPRRHVEAGLFGYSFS
jgi:hypothetical protein